MLLQFRCSNHKSIREEILFSALAGTENPEDDRITREAGFNILRQAVIYGANGSGKSNFISAVAFVKDLVLNSVSLQPGQGISQSPHKKGGFGEKSSYMIQFITDGVRYAYGFSLKNMLIEEEYLYYFPNAGRRRFSNVKVNHTRQEADSGDDSRF